MNDADASQFIELKTRGGTYYQLMDGSPRSQFDKVEQRFMESDLGDLCELRLLMLNYNANGSRIFQITREGAALPGISGDA